MCYKQNIFRPIFKPILYIIKYKILTIYYIIILGNKLFIICQKSSK